MFDPTFMVFGSFDPGEYIEALSNEVKVHPHVRAGFHWRSVDIDEVIVRVHGRAVK
jgi:hypothetical protein